MDHMKGILAHYFPVQFSNQAQKVYGRRFPTITNHLDCPQHDQWGDPLLFLLCCRPVLGAWAEKTSLGA